jgi:hypothetical protein
MAAKVIAMPRKRVVGTRIAADGSTVRILAKRRSPRPAPPPVEHVSSEEFTATVEEFAATAKCQTDAIEALSANVSLLTDLSRSSPRRSNRRAAETMAGILFDISRTMFACDTDWSSPTQTFKVLLASSDYEPRKSHAHVSDVDGELTGGGYARQTLKNRAVYANEDDGRADCHANAVKFANLATAESYRWIVVYREGKSDATSDLICAIDMAKVPLKDIETHTVEWDSQHGSGRVFSLL